MPGNHSFFPASIKCRCQIKRMNDFEILISDLLGSYGDLFSAGILFPILDGRKPRNRNVQPWIFTSRLVNPLQEGKETDANMTAERTDTDGQPERHGRGYVCHEDLAASFSFFYLRGFRCRMLRKYLPHFKQHLFNVLFSLW